MRENLHWRIAPPFLCFKRDLLSFAESVEQLGLEVTVVERLDEACKLDQGQSGYFGTVLVDSLGVFEHLRDLKHLCYIPLLFSSLLTYLYTISRWAVLAPLIVSSAIEMPRWSRAAQS